MKKVLLSILTTLYLLLSTGFTLDVHYCMGSIASIDITSNEDSTCAKCGMKEKNTGCCRDEVRFYKFDKGFKSSKCISYDHPFVTSSLPDFGINRHFPVASKISFVSTSIEPLIGGPPIYLRNRVFRI